MYDSMSVPYGYVARNIDPAMMGMGLVQKSQAGQKTLTMAEANRGSWYRAASSDSLLLVEDQLSAIKASQYVNSVSLLGTHFSPEFLTELRAFLESAGGKRIKHIYLALDKDAFAKAIGMVIALRAHTKNIPVHIMKLDKDIKDMAWSDIETLLNKYEVT